MLPHTRLSLHRALAAAAFTCVFGSYASAQVAIPPTADAYVRAGSFSAQNFGTAHTIPTKKGAEDANTRRAYLTFDVSTVGATDRVALRLSGRLSSAASHNVVTTIYAVPDVTWGENTITWNSRPNLGKVLGTVTLEDTDQQWVTLDVTKYVRAEKTAGRQIISIALRDVVHSSAVSIFNSREASVGAPALIVTAAP